MEPDVITDKAALLRSLHRRGAPLVLVNAWDVASALAVVAAGAPVVATSSAAIAASLGQPWPRSIGSRRSCSAAADARR